MFKKLCIVLIISIITALAVNRICECYFNPGSQFFGKCFQQTRLWENELRKTDAPCYIFAGGSEVRMTIEPQSMLQEHGIRAINTGSSASNGIRCNAQIALDYIRPHDTLVLSVNPGNYNLSLDGTTQEGINFCLTHNKFSSLLNGIIPFNKETFLAVLCGSSNRYCTRIVRSFTKPYSFFYDYSPHASIGLSGRVNVITLKIQEQAKINPILPSSRANKKPLVVNGWKELVSDLQNILREKKARLIIYISRAYNMDRTTQYDCAQFALYLTKMGIPVVKDPQLGSCSNAENYSDTNLHQSIEGGRRFSAWLAKQLKENQFWTTEELEELLQQF